MEKLVILPKNICLTCCRCCILKKVNGDDGIRKEHKLLSCFDVTWVVAVVGAMLYGDDDGASNCHFHQQFLLFLLHLENCDDCDDTFLLLFFFDSNFVFVA